MLAADLHAQVSLDLDALFVQLAGQLTGVDLGDVRFDASGILGVVGGAAVPDLAGVLGIVGSVSGSLGARLGVGVPGGELPDLVTRLSAMLGNIGALLPSGDPDVSIGLDGLAARIGSLEGAVRDGPLVALFGLVPDLSITSTIDRVGGSLGALVDLIRVLAGLTSTSTISTRVLARSEHLRTSLDAAAAASVALARAAGDAQLVVGLRTADPADPSSVGLLTDRIVEFLQAVITVDEQWSIGMGFGEAAVIGLDLSACAAGLELARLALSGVELEGIRALALELVGLGRPFLDMELPVPGPGVLMDEALTLVGAMVESVRAFDATSIVAPLTRLTDLALGPLDAVRETVETVANGAASAIRSIRDIVTEVDLRQVSDAVRRALQPVVDTLDAIEGAIDTAQSVIVEVAGNITAGLETVAGEVEVAATTVTTALGTVRSALDELHLADLAENLRTGLSGVAAQLASAQLTPYFDTAIDVIDTGAAVIDAVPFELLPTDVQQEIVDVCRPIKALDLQPIEDALRAELAEIVQLFQEDALAAIEAAFAEVVTFLQSLNPQPFLEELEADALGTLRDLVDEIDPEALLAPAQAALDEVRGLLDGIDLDAMVLRPLADLFQPVLDALDAIDPAALLEPITSQIDAARGAVVGLLHLDTITEAVNGFRGKVDAAVALVDPARLATALDAAVTAEIAKLPAGPPGGPFGSLLVTLAQASGFDATEGAVGDTIAWVGGGVRGSQVVRERITTVAGRLRDATAAARALDPAPLVAAAQAQHRAITTALSVHPADSPLRLAVDVSLANVVPAAVLGPLAENRARYVARLDSDVMLADALAASGRSEIDAAAAELRAALIPLDAFPAKLRSLLGALGVPESTASFRDLLTALIDVAGPGRLVPALTELGVAVRDQVSAVVAAATQPVLDAVATVHAIIDAFDVGPIVADLVALHDQIVAEVAGLSPAALLTDVITEANEVIQRLHDFDPLAPVRDVIDAAKAAADSVLESSRPTVVFAPVVQIHADVVALAAGLDVGGLLRPVLDALTAIAGQLDDGFDRTGDSLIRLQASLPSEVSASGGGISGSLDVSIG